MSNAYQEPTGEETNIDPVYFNENGLINNLGVKGPLG